MDKKGKIILISTFVIIFAVFGFKYKQFFLDKDFLFMAQVNCDPATEQCFRVICDGECDNSSKFIFNDGSPYKYIELPARNVPQCLVETTCPDFECKESDDCSITYCSEETLEDGEECISTTATTSIINTNDQN
jgi:hypothetical protein